MTTPPDPQAVETERARVTSIIDEMIAGMETRPPNYDMPFEAVIDMLEYIKERINVSETEANHCSGQ